MLKKDLEELLQQYRELLTDAEKANKLLQDKLDFISNLTPNSSMIIAMEKMTDALAHTIDIIKRR